MYSMKIKRPGNTEEASVKIFDVMCVYECEGVSWGGGCAWIRKHKTGNMYNTCKDLGLGFPSETSLQGHMFVGNLLPGSRP